MWSVLSMEFRVLFFELKAHHTDLRNAYTDNITDYKDTITHVFHCNAFIILSNGTDAKVGTVTSPYKFFLDWKRITEEEEGIVSLDTMLTRYLLQRKPYGYI